MASFDRSIFFTTFNPPPHPLLLLYSYIVKLKASPPQIARGYKNKYIVVKNMFKTGLYLEIERISLALLFMLKVIGLSGPFVGDRANMMGP